MHLITKILLPAVILLCLFSCGEKSHNTCGSAWIGGEIVNPKHDYVIISRSRELIDTVYLDNNNFFLYQLESLDPGIYFFSHNEYQALYIEPGDSLMLRVNTIEFDESLSFTGKGAQKNNLLMDLFLLNEEVDEMMPSMHLLTPKEFDLKIDALKKNRISQFNSFLSKENASKDFKNIAKGAIDYAFYAKKELYISANDRKKIYDENVEIPKDFYNFRKNIDYGNEQLRSYYPYYRFLSFHLDNLAYERYKKEGPYDRDSFLHNLNKNQLIDSLITNETLKNSLLRTTANRYFLNAKDKENEKIVLEQFKKISTNQEDIEEVIKLANATINLTPGHTIPNLMLLTAENTVKDLHSTFNRPTVLYFWSNKSVNHYRKIHTRANELKGKYPEYNFIGINIDTHFKNWLKIIKRAGYSDVEEYQFEDFDTAEKKLVINSVNKAMIVDNKGIILNGNTNIFDLAIENELLGFLNR